MRKLHCSLHARSGAAILVFAAQLLFGSSAFAKDPHAELCEFTELCQEFIDFDREIHEGEPNYHIWRSCQDYAERFHRFCQQNSDKPTRTVSVQCSGANVGHQLNMVQLSDGTWQFVDTVNGELRFPGQPFPDPNNAPQASICEAIFREAPCDCSIMQIWETPKPTTLSTVSCVRQVATFAQTQLFGPWEDPGAELNAECNKCCKNETAYFFTVAEGPQGIEARRLADDYFNGCTAECNGTFQGRDTRRWGWDSAEAFGSQCSASTTFFSASSRYEQCRGCCLDGAVQKKYNRDDVASCLSFCGDPS